MAWGGGGPSGFSNWYAWGFAYGFVAMGGWVGGWVGGGMILNASEEFSYKVCGQISVFDVMLFKI